MLKKTLISLSLVFLLMFFIPEVSSCYFGGRDYFNESKISLLQTDYYFDLEKIKDNLGEDYYLEDNNSLFFNCVDNSPCSLVISQKTALFQFKNFLDAGYWRGQLKYTYEQYLEKYEEYKGTLRNSCLFNLAWMHKISATSLGMEDINKICDVIDLKGYVGYGKLNSYIAYQNCIKEDSCANDCSESFSQCTYVCEGEYPLSDRDRNLSLMNKLNECRESCKRKREYCLDACTEFKQCIEASEANQWLFARNSCAFLEDGLICYECGGEDIKEASFKFPEMSRNFYNEIKPLIDSNIDFKEKEIKGKNYTNLIFILIFICLLAIVLAVVIIKKKNKQY
ncbi:hypothetical protein KY348_05205 [Candidatus Woesearchaeota archaeon]|nr:hypothetical protein [Candidatus Woesearchaeota archaeon]